MDEELRLRKRNLIMYPLGTVGRDMIYNLFTNFILTYILFTRKLNAAQLAAITAIMVGARVFDALNDPIMGNIIERTRTKWGKFKPWLVIGILSTSVVVYLAFNTDLQGWSFIWFFGVIYFMYSITYTMHDISYWGMIPPSGGTPTCVTSLPPARRSSPVSAARSRGSSSPLYHRCGDARRLGELCLRAHCARYLHYCAAISVLHGVRRA